MNRFAASLACAVAVVGIILLVGSSEEDASAGGQQGHRVCDIPGGSITVAYTPDHPYRIGIIEIDENCAVSKRYEDLTAQQFSQLANQAGGKSEIASPDGPATSSPDTAVALATVYTKKVKGRQVLCHDVGVSCVDMVEVSSQMRWWYDYTRVTSYGEGLGRRWAGSCWDFDGSFSVWWRTEYMPDAIGIAAYSKFKTAWYCPWFPGGWLRTTTRGWYDGYYYVICEHDDLKKFPPPARVKCWAELL